MGRYASDTGSGEFTQAPEGSLLARCVRLIDLGTHHDTYEGKPIIRNQVLVTFELPGETIEIDGEHKPLTISRFYTNSLSEKANLRKDLESWRGRQFTQEELERFDLQNILGAPAILSVVHNLKGKAQIKAVMKVPKGMTVPDAYNEPYAFWLDEFDREAFNELTDGIKKIVMESDEYKAMNGNGGVRTPPPSAKNVDQFDDDIPF